MTVEEMHASVLLKIDKVGSYSTSNLIPGEIDDFLNEAIRDYVSQQEQYLRNAYLEDSSSNVQENLYTIIETDEISSINSHPFLDRVFTIDISSELTDYDYFASGRAKFDSGEAMLAPVPTSYIVDDEKTVYEDPFNNYIPVAVEEDQILGKYTSDFSSNPNSVVINYVQTPTEVFLDPSNSSNNVDSDLPERTHRNIVNIAARKIISSLSGQTPGQREEE
jgi:hypothetical protein